LFIDANIYLRFYSYTEDTFDELEKLTALVETDKILVHLPEQIKSEVSRHREAEISRALKRFEQCALKVEIPNFARHFPESANLQAQLKTVSEAKSKLTEKINKEVMTDSLRADDLIGKLGLLAKTSSMSNDQLERAKLRCALGDPPGKRETLGDQIAWEILLDTVPEKSDLHIVTNDGDYYSKLNSDEPHACLKSEWAHANGGALNCYKNLSKFTNAHFPHIKLPIDAIKFDAISKLANSGSFERTHQQIEKLKTIDADLTFEDAVILFQAMIENSQINWIAKDEDVQSFYKNLHESFFDQTSPELDQQLHEVADYFTSVPF